MNSNTKPKVYVPRIIWDWNYMSRRNIDILSNFSDPVVEPTGTGPIPEDELVRRMHGARALIVRNGQGTEDITARVLKEVGSVEVAVFAHSAYYGPIWDTASKCGIRTVEGSDGVDRAVAEWTVAAAIMGLRRLIEAGDSLKTEGVWQKEWKRASLLYGSTVGLLGLGRIGRMVAVYFQMLGAKVLAFDKYFDPDKAKILGIEMRDLQTLVSESDVVSLHLPVTPETRGIFTREYFDLLKDGAVFINSARAALYDEQQLVEALRSNRFSAYLDVYDKEPLDPTHPFHALPNVFTSSHIAGTNDVMYERMGLDAINTLRDYFQTGVLRDSREPR